MPSGEVALEAQYLQPLNAGGKRTFQRFPQIFHRYTGGSSDGTFVIDMNSQFVHFWREKGFHISRLALMPNISTQGLHLGHIVGLRPQAKLREILYSHGRTSSQESFRERGTVWLGFEAVSSLSRRFFLGQGHRLRHSIKPSLFYEYVPKTEQADLAQVDALDNFPNKNLMTYSLNTSFRDEWSGGISTTLLDLTLAQSYHLGVSPGQATSFSDIWGRATVGLPTTQLLPFISIATISFDTFFDPGKGEFSQFNYDINLQAKETAYIKIGRRHTRIGTVPRRGDIWNPLSFNEVFAPTSEIDFLTIGGAIRTPFGWTIGSQIYRDVINEVTPEWDVVALYQNPCRCWSFALYYIELGEGGGLPERNQFNFALTLRGVGATEGTQTELLRAILGPILGNESGLPWSIN